jgi:hypothetical protein
VDHIRTFAKMLSSEPAVRLAGIVAAILVAVGGAYVLTAKPSCGPTVESTDRVQLVVTAHNRGCNYTLTVGQKFALISGPGDEWASWPPRLSNPGLVSDEGRSVGSLGPGPVWEFDYMAQSPGVLVLKDEAITIRIRR